MACGKTLRALACSTQLLLRLALKEFFLGPLHSSLRVLFLVHGIHEADLCQCRNGYSEFGTANLDASAFLCTSNRRMISCACFAELQGA